MLKKIIKQLRNCITIIGFWKGSMLIFYIILYRFFRFYPPIAFFFLSLKHQIILNYLRKLDQTKRVPIMKPKKEVSAKTIWMFWWQGKSNMPELVRACIRSVKQHAGEYNIQLITKDNITEYLDIPILSKVGKSITLINFSDYIRLSLLKTYGGGWIDATIFLTQDIPTNITATGFYTIRHPRKTYFCVSDFRWGVSFLFTEKENKLISKVYELFTGYWEKNNSLLDYFLIDYCFAYIIETDKECKKILESVPYNNPLTYNGIVDKFSQPFDHTVYKEIIKETWIHKLSYKVPYCSNKEKPTFYDFVIQTC